MSVPVRQAAADRLPALAGVLARAFRDDPMLRWPLGDGAGYEERLECLHHLVNVEPIARGLVWEAGDGLGAAVWIPPGTDLSETEAALRERVSAQTDDNGIRLRIMWDWPTPCFLRSLGDPPHRIAGSQIGNARAVQRSDDERAPVGGEGENVRDHAPRAEWSSSISASTSTKRTNVSPATASRFVL